MARHMYTIKIHNKRNLSFWLREEKMKIYPFSKKFAGKNMKNAMEEKTDCFVLRDFWS